MEKEHPFPDPEPPADGYMPLAVPVFKETLDLALPEGEYQIRIRLDHGAQAAAGRLTFYASSPRSLDSRKIRQWGWMGRLSNYYEQYGVEINDDADIILAGNCVGDAVEDIFRCVGDGATAVFLDMAALTDDAEHLFDHKDHPLGKLPFEKKGCCTYLETGITTTRVL